MTYTCSLAFFRTRLARFFKYFFKKLHTHTIFFHKNSFSILDPTILLVSLQSPSHTTPHQNLIMKWIILSVAALAFFSAVRAEDDEFLSDDQGEARLGFITVNGDGTTSLTFNATSIQNAVILGLFILVLGALLLPLFGLFGGEEETSGYGGYEQTGGYQTGYEQQSTGYNTYAKRLVI